MAQIAIVRRSDLMAHGRWDAGFHIALTELRGAIDVLRERYSDEAATEMVDGLPLPDKTGLEVLRTGSHRRGMNAAEAREIARRYPHLSLALVARDAEASVSRIREEIARRQDALARLTELSDSRTSKLDAIAADARVR